MSTNLPLPDPEEPREGHARADGGDTMWDAARFQRRVSGPARLRVLRLVIRREPLGITDDEVEQITRMLHQTASARRRELVQMGWIVDSGGRRPTSSGRPATVWVLTDRARGYLAERLAGRQLT